MSEPTTIDAKDAAAASPTESAAATRPAPRPQIEVTDTKCVASYANFCRVTGTPEAADRRFWFQQEHES